MVETGIIGLIIVLLMFQQMFAVTFRLFKKSNGSALSRLGLGLFLAICACIVANSSAIDGPILKSPGCCGCWLELRFARINSPKPNRRYRGCAVDSTLPVNPYMVYR